MKQMAAYLNYVDALSYALAIRAPEREEVFAADPARWQQAILDLKQEFATALPIVFKRMTFDEREGRPPHSVEVDHFLHVMSQARLMSKPNVALETLTLNPEQQKAIVRLNEDRLHELRPALTDLGNKLAAAVAAVET